MERTDIYHEIDLERARQEMKWNKKHSWGSGSCAGNGISNAVRATVLCEEIREIARATLERSENLKNELIQTAAVCVAWLESLE